MTLGVILFPAAAATVAITVHPLDKQIPIQNDCRALGRILNWRAASSLAGRRQTGRRDAEGERKGIYPRFNVALKERLLKHFRVNLVRAREQPAR